MIYGEGSAEFSTFVRVVKRCPWVPIIGSGRSTIRPVFLDDLLEVVWAALTQERGIGRTYEVCGSTNVSFDRLVLLIAAQGGVRRRIVHVPGSWALAGARGLGTVLRHPPITVDQVLGFLQDTVADPGPAMRDLGFVPRSVEDGLALLFNRTPWTAW
jgi:NADH dehydrogenase